MPNADHERTLSATETIYALCDTYKGAWLMPRVVTLKNDTDGKDLAIGDLTITANNPFINMHPHGFPGVMTAEFTQQLGFLIMRKTYGLEGRPFMLGLEVNSRLAINIGDTVTAITKLTETKGRGKRLQFYFESIVSKGDVVVMTTKFHGMPVPSKTED